MRVFPHSLASSFCTVTLTILSTTCFVHNGVVGSWGRTGDDSDSWVDIPYLKNYLTKSYHRRLDLTYKQEFNDFKVMEVAMFSVDDTMRVLRKRRYIPGPPRDQDTPDLGRYNIESLEREPAARDRFYWDAFGYLAAWDSEFKECRILLQPWKPDLQPSQLKEVKFEKRGERWEIASSTWLRGSKEKRTVCLIWEVFEKLENVQRQENSELDANDPRLQWWLRYLDGEQEIPGDADEARRKVPHPTGYPFQWLDCSGGKRTMRFAKVTF
ncbi:Uu.00g122260.m01.CDS01 [Anthostomella pinea]|uniref:Uu.00g122260.m01.CDS01 n=1 Tax=Anthostomella pinea TaxID=933095 RepID=A0AAI8YHI7_9PEZI|nr:Uu.00g122260.m01.CDS01 [Anthostomella pinea]